MNIAEAKSQITRILKALEEDQGATVESISLQRLEFRQVGEPAPRHIVSVEIEMQRKPGNDWG